MCYLMFFSVCSLLHLISICVNALSTVHELLSFHSLSNFKYVAIHFPFCPITMQAAGGGGHAPDGSGLPVGSIPAAVTVAGSSEQFLEPDASSEDVSEGSSRPVLWQPDATISCTCSSSAPPSTKPRRVTFEDQIESPRDVCPSTPTSTSNCTSL